MKIWGPLCTNYEEFQEGESKPLNQAWALLSWAPPLCGPRPPPLREGRAWECWERASLEALPWQLLPAGAARPAPSQLPLQVPTAHGPPWPSRDRFRTMINVLGDALAAGIMAHVCRKDFAQDTVTEVRTVRPPQPGHPKAPGG